MRTLVNLEVLGTGEALEALAALMGLFFCVGARVDEHFVTCVEATVRPRTSLPLAVVQTAARCRGMGLGHMTSQLFQRIEASANHK